MNFSFLSDNIFGKNTALIIQALDLVRDLPFRMYFVGTGYAAEDMKQMVKKEILKIKLFYRKYLRQRRTQTHYAAANLFFSIHLHNAPLVVQKRALHTPAVIAAGSTTSEIIVDNVTDFN